MYFKVAIVSFLALFLSGCSFFSKPKPKPKQPDIKVVETVDNNTTNVQPNKVMVEESPAVEKKYKLKPEPFSLNSNEQDPELLGPQTTLNRELPTGEKKDSVDKIKNKITNKKDSLKTTKMTKSSKDEISKNTNENKKETL